ncbi:hypothetical protein B7463_g3751, partial [Scytalidium lignicola]
MPSTKPIARLLQLLKSLRTLPRAVPVLFLYVGKLGGSQPVTFPFPLSSPALSIIVAERSLAQEKQGTGTARAVDSGPCGLLGGYQDMAAAAGIN